MSRPHTSLLVAVSVVLAACTGASPDSPTSSPATTVASTTITNEAAATPVPDLLAIIDDEERVALTTPDAGEERIVSRPGTTASQPTLAPDGRTLAWTEIASSGTAAIAIAATAVEGEPAVIDVPFPPFFYLWSPDAERLAFLGNREPGVVGLGIADPVRGTAEVIDGGRPYYLAWDPSGDRLITHIGNEVAVLDLTGDPPDRTPLSADGGLFRAPQWTADGSRVAFVVSRGASDGVPAANRLQAQPSLSEQELVVAAPDGSDAVTIGSFGGVVSFDLHPDGARIAYSVTPPGLPINFGPLWVAGVGAADSPQRIGDGDVVAYEWSRDGSMLLALEAEIDGDAEGPAGFVPLVWNGDESRRYEGFRPTGRFSAEYLPFWDQYARSLTLWAPDGASFVYAAATERGDEILLQPIEGGAPRRIAGGSVVSWAR